MFIHRIAAALCGLALFVVAADARANWSNTHWGMTVAEVQAIAPNGRALTDVEADAFARVYDGSIVPKWAVPYRLGDVDFDAVLHFRKEDDGLEFVELLLRDQSQAQKLLDAMRAAFGAPAGEESNMFQVTTSWEIDGDLVQVMQDGVTIVRIQPQG